MTENAVGSGAHPQHSPSPPPLVPEGERTTTCRAGGSPHGSEDGLVQPDESRSPPAPILGNWSPAIEISHDGSALVIGLDGGGTKTSAVAGPRDGRILSRASAGPCNVAAMEPADALGSAITAINQALQGAIRSGPVAAICACVAGVSAEPRRLALMQGLGAAFPNAVIAVEADYAAALTGATGGGPGIVVIAGTGSVAYGEDGEGHSARAGAYGYLIDDAGSGYGVGRAAIAAVLRAGDGTAPETSLTEMLLSHLGLQSPIDLVAEVYGGRLDRVSIASLAPFVAAAADTDTEARKILNRAGGALAILADAVSRKLFPDGELAIATVGSLWQSGTPLTDVFQRSVQRFAPKAVLIESRHDPAHGAYLRALALLRQ